ncbi:MAG: FKBP-type peptidyl-prolyl cis-trans isomerase [Bacteroides sp.]|nr:FKBP-type peptidyl-prolyl cis-trans isomerase [Bacteroides sp.]MCM1378666.1 FKBP-type peptidyl-prolyl cis-trans isomerase [Bacteroides sp.]MCM1444939.1 FKBP-type peptidyl-prolyl cis-trans isomerase [Prevotella sp.]
MKLLKPFIALALVAGFSSCQKTDYEKLWDEYEKWRGVNDEWLREQTIDGKYTKVTPKWNDEISVLMRWLNDTTETSGNLTPLYTSSILVKYKGWLCDDTPFDSTYALTDSVTTLKPSGLIDGWVIALEQMHVGDKVELIVPYEAGYGSNASGSVPPFSNLRFELELRDVPTYELRPE